MFNLCNFAAYQLVWFAVILGAARGHALAGAAAALAATAAHLWLRREPLERKLIGVAVVMGLMVDTTLAATAQARFAGVGDLPIAPFWMLALWMAFATTLNHSLRWLMLRPVAAAAAGAVFGPLAYLAGAKLGALSLATPAIGLPLISVLWIAAMSVFSLLVRPARMPADGSLAA